jgi:integrase
MISVPVPGGADCIHCGSVGSVPYIPMLRESAPRSRFFEREQHESLSRAFPDYLRSSFALGYFTAMRHAEILGLQGEHVDFLLDVIRLRAGETKNDDARVIPHVPKLRALLVGQWVERQDPCPYVCFRLDRKGHAVKIGNFRKVWQSRCVKLGFGKVVVATDPTTGEPLFERHRGLRSKPKVKMVYQGMIFHDLRRSGVRNLTRAGVSEKVAREIAGTRRVPSLIGATSCPKATLSRRGGNSRRSMKSPKLVTVQ